VILVHVNVLVYAHVAFFTLHARDWVNPQLNGAPPVGLPRASLLAFLWLVTNPRVFEHPEPITDAWRQVLVWLDCETVWIPQPAEHDAVLRVGVGAILTMAPIEAIAGPSHKS
jgi:uncharacterized protein